MPRAGYGPLGFLSGIDGVDLDKAQKIWILPAENTEWQVNPAVSLKQPTMKTENKENRGRDAT